MNQSTIGGAATAIEVLSKVSAKRPDQLKPEQSLVADLGIDPPRALELLVELEDALGIEISDDDAARMETVGDVLDFASSIS